MSNKFTPKTKKKIKIWLRAVIQLLFFVFLSAAFTSGFSAVKYIFTQMGAKKPIQFTSFISIFLVLCVFTFVFGRFFCGYACAFGTFGDALHTIYIGICRKRKKKPLKCNEKLETLLPAVRYLLLIAIVFMCFFGVYSKTRGYSPWDVFSMLRSGNLHMTGYIPGILILICLLVGMTLVERFFCRFLCPLGAIFSLLPVLPVFSLFRHTDDCIKGCNACKRNCPASISLPDQNKYSCEGDCLQCQKCIGVCPKGNIHTGIHKMKGNELWFTVFKAALLAGLLIIAGA